MNIGEFDGTGHGKFPGKVSWLILVFAQPSFIPVCSFICKLTPFIQKMIFLYVHISKWAGVKYLLFETSLAP